MWGSRLGGMGGTTVYSGRMRSETGLGNLAAMGGGKPVKSGGNIPDTRHEARQKGGCGIASTAGKAGWGT